MHTGSCGICDNDQNNTIYTVKEMMFGTKAAFDYLECAHCGCLQIGHIPENMFEYYPSDYFSFRPLSGLRRSFIRSFIDKRRIKEHLLGGSLIGRIASFFSKPLDYVEWFRFADIKPDSSILDVGCGQGRFLTRLALAGFPNLTGLDPFISEDVVYTDSFKLLKTDIVTFAGATAKRFDLITMQHSLEHMSGQIDVLLAAKKLLSEKGCLLIIVPVADSYAWEHYREHWYQLDAPRHFFLHTAKSMALACEQAGMEVVRCDNRSAPEQLIGSELYKRGIPGNRKVSVDSVLSKAELNQLQELARQAGKEGKGDQTTFFIRRKSD